MGNLNEALQLFDSTEANLRKLFDIWIKIETHLPTGPAFGAPPEYDELCYDFRQLLKGLPAIDGFRVDDCLMEYDALGQWYLDALDIGEPNAQLAADRAASEQGRLLRQYRSKLSTKRRELVRDRIVNTIAEIDRLLPNLYESCESAEVNAKVAETTETGWDDLNVLVDEIATLIGSAARPPRWGDLQRHLSYGMVGDLRDIQQHDWPAVKNGLRKSLYGSNEPIPVAVADLGDVVSARPQGHALTKLNWESLTEEDFERLIFTLIADTSGYENPEWLQQTNAPDKGRDLSVTYVEFDPLSGQRRFRVIIQCKHWLTKSVGLRDVSCTRDQMALWEPPRVDRLVFATSGRFTSDAVSWIECHNQKDHALTIMMWPDSHLERLLTARPHLIGQFRLRRID